MGIMFGRILQLFQGGFEEDDDDDEDEDEAHELAHLRLINYILFLTDYTNC